MERDRTRKTTILFLCTGNSCRSQMAEGWTRHLHGGRFEVYSAGLEPKGLDPRAVLAMGEVGVDISRHKSKHVRDLGDIEFDYVITVCGHADEHCPVFPGPTKKIHVGFEDPPQLARDARTEEEALGHYRRIRGEIRDFIRTLPQFLEQEQT
jgi:arsenate reductase